MKAKSGGAVARRFGMRTRIVRPRISLAGMDAARLAEALHELAHSIEHSRGLDEETMRGIAMAITPRREELAAIRAHLPRTDFDYDGPDEPFVRRPGR